MSRKKGISARERLLRAALQLFAERGQRASVEEIARQARVAKGTVYYHFGSKRRLIQQALEAELEQLASSLPSSADPTEQVRAAIERLARWAISRPERLQALLLAGQPGSGLAAEVGHRLRDRALQLLQRAMALAHAAKLIAHSEPPELIAVALFGALVYILEYWQRQGRLVNPRQLSLALLNYLLRR